MIVIIDYGLGNVLAFANLYKRLNIPVRVAKTSDALNEADKLILPGVGAFDYAMERLEESGMRESIDALVLNKGVPVLGVCVGMHMIAQGSEEGKLEGLGWIPGRVRRFDTSFLSQKTQLPHMGWNDVSPIHRGGLFAKLETEAKFYFLHSYFFDCQKPEDSLAYAEYGKKFSCAINSGNIYGVQFHPEKSHFYGTQLLKNFAEM